MDKRNLSLDKFYISGNDFFNLICKLAYVQIENLHPRIAHILKILRAKKHFEQKNWCGAVLFELGAVTETMFSRIQNIDYTIPKQAIVSICIVYGFSLEIFNELLSKGGYTLREANRIDSLYERFITENSTEIPIEYDWKDKANKLLLAAGAKSNQLLGIPENK